MQAPVREGDHVRIPSISVVMSVFNGERFLRDAIESILNQSFCDFEFIIIDDGSTESIGSILDWYQKSDPRIRVYHQENRGLIESLNRACGLARGKYIARMDADDIATPDRLGRQLQYMEAHPGVAVLGGAVEIIDANGKLRGNAAPPTGDDAIRSNLQNGNTVFYHPTVMMRKEVFLAVGGYREVVVDAEDFDLWTRIADKHKLANLAQVVLKYRRHPHQVS